MLQTYVSPPRPIEVKKLMENRVFLGLSRGSKPSNARERSLEKESKERNCHGIVVSCCYDKEPREEIEWYCVICYNSVVSCCYDNIRVSEPFVQLGHAHKLSQLLEQNLHKDTTGGRENTHIECDIH